MPHILISFLILIIFCDVSKAENYEVLDQPICFKVMNKDTQKIYGSVETAPLPGQFSGHAQNFNVEIDNFVEFCTSGPLYEGQRIRVELKSIVPFFSCKTSIHQDIVIQREKDAQGQYLKDKTGQTKWIECF